MKASEIRERTDSELIALTGQSRDDYYKLRVQHATNQLEDTSTIRSARKAIARVETIRSARKRKIEDSKSDS